MAIPNIVKNDSWLMPFVESIQKRTKKYEVKKKELLGNKFDNLTEFASGFKSFGYFIDGGDVIFREWLPNATSVYLIGDFSDWKPNDNYKFENKNGAWELKISNIKHGDKYKLKVCWQGGEAERIPAWATRVIQDEKTLVFDAQIWSPKEQYEWKSESPIHSVAPLIYEAHIGMGGEDQKVSSFNEFRENVLPRIVKLGYNTIQLMAIQEHPYYGSFGYHVSNFFAASSRFGTPEELKLLIDEAHANGIKVIMDMVHSHAVKNELEGLGKYDGTRYQFFHEGDRGEHPAWDSLCFNYGKSEVLHFLLSNIRYWIEEYKFDGYRFDGVTSMLYFDHGLERDFTSYSCYFDGGQDEEAITYLMLANDLMSEMGDNLISIAEEMSGYPGLANSVKDGGVGFNYRLAMGIPDFWIKTLKEKKDEDWILGQLYHELTSRRDDEKTISYTESHDQALVGDKTIAFRLMDKDMYFHMLADDMNINIERGIALHKMIRLITVTTAGGGYLNFMGNEFGHPEWIDFPREGNEWSYMHARRQWSLVDREDLKYKFLNKFDEQMIQLVNKDSLLDIYPLNIQHCDENNKVIAYSRSKYIFVFNFNATQSYTDYQIPVAEGRYKYVFSSDEKQNGGFGRIDEDCQYNTQLTTVDGKFQHLSLYLPTRTALVLEKIPIPSVRVKKKK